MRALDKQTRTPYALKVVKGPSCEQALALLEQEGRAHAAMPRHANIAPLLAAVDDGAGRLHGIVTPVASEDDLHTWLSYGRHAGPPLEYHDILAAADGALAGLEQVHAAGYAHLDLKPDNLLLYERDLAAAGAIKVADFGHCLRVGAWMYTEQHGTAGYIAPEAAAPGGKLASRAMDVHAFGAVLLQLAAQRVINLNLSYDGIIAATRAGRLHATYVAALEDQGGAPASLVALAADCMRPDPAERPTVPELRAYIVRLAKWYADKPELRVAPPPAAACALADIDDACRAKLKPLALGSQLSLGCGGSPTIGVPAPYGPSATPLAPLPESPVAAVVVPLGDAISTPDGADQARRHTPASAARDAAEYLLPADLLEALGCAPASSCSSSGAACEANGERTQPVLAARDSSYGDFAAALLPADLLEELGAAPASSSCGDGACAGTPPFPAAPESSFGDAAAALLPADLLEALGAAPADTRSGDGVRAGAPPFPAAPVARGSCGGGAAALLPSHLLEELGFVPDSSRGGGIAARCAGAFAVSRPSAGERTACAAPPPRGGESDSEGEGGEDDVWGWDAVACAWEERYYARACRSRGKGRAQRARGKRCFR